MHHFSMCAKGVQFYCPSHTYNAIVPFLAHYEWARGRVGEKVEENRQLKVNKYFSTPPYIMKSFMCVTTSQSTNLQGGRSFRIFFQKKLILAFDASSAACRNTAMKSVKKCNLGSLTVCINVFKKFFNEVA